MALMQVSDRLPSLSMNLLANADADGRTPTVVKPRILSTTINEDDGTAAVTLAMSVAKYFELEPANAREIAKQVAQAVSKWRAKTARHGLTKNESNRMASAFEHQDLKEAFSR